MSRLKKRKKKTHFSNINLFSSPAACKLLEDCVQICAREMCTEDVQERGKTHS